MAKIKYVLNPFTGDFDSINGDQAAVTRSPKLISTFYTTTDTQVGMPVRVTGNLFVEKIDTNSSSEIPNGIFGICFAKPTDTTADVIFVGSLSAYSGLTVGSPVFIATDGTVGHTVPLTGMVQQVGFAVSPSEVFFNFMQPMRRS